MIDPGKKHPPKKKHRNRPRPEPVVPLTDIQRMSKAGEEYAKALIHLVEAERLAAWGEAPNACVHSAYYAMYHAASAAILASGGVGKHLDVPKSHEHVIQHYGKLTQPESGFLAESGRVLNRARTDRMVADYGLVGGASKFDATTIAADARKFVDACTEKWGLVGSPVRARY